MEKSKEKKEKRKRVKFVKLFIIEIPKMFSQQLYFMIKNR